MDLTDMPCAPITHMLLAALFERASLGGPIATPGSVGVSVGKIKLFVRYLAGHPSPPIGVTDLERQHLDGFEDRLREEHGSEKTFAAVSVLAIVVLLKAASAIGFPLASDLRARLTWNINGDWGSNRTYEPYTFDIWDSVRTAAAEAQRKTVRSRHAIATEVWGGPAKDLLEEVIATGKIAGDGFARAKNCGGAQRIYRKAFILKQDLVPFILRLAMETGWEPDVIRGLRADCLVNESNGTVGVLTRKRRRHGSEHKEVRVKDGSLSTPGGIIRAVITLTASARATLGSDMLWLGHQQFGSLGVYKFDDTKSLFRQFVTDYGLTDPDGGPLKLNLVRIRKTYKSLRYRALNGDMNDFPNGHSADVAARNYANVETNRDLHEQTISDGILDFLTATDGQAKPSNPSPQPATSHPTDTWLSTCVNIYESPYGEIGKPCKAVPWMCFACPNSVSSPHKLPAQLAFMKLAHDQRHQLSAEVWNARYGYAWTHLAREIIPRFSAEEIAEAKLIAGHDPANGFLTIAMGVEV
ncbi:hypothetical protein [Arthrobacter sp. GAS37]|uniref:hypothetical protein n=1 Tax=Arthrobacter sp. GAS37 TaxID=3156261 RepID=UPI003850CE45